MNHGSVARMLLVSSAFLIGAASIQKVETSKWFDFGNKDNVDSVMIPVEVEGYKGKCVMQLDSGSDATVLYTKKEGVTPDPKEPRYLYRNLKIGGIKFGKRPFLKLHSMPTYVNEKGKYTVIGTIGLDCMTDHVWSIDFVSNKFAVSDFWYQMPPEARKPGTDLSVVLRDRKMFIPVSVDGKTVEDYFYDTGAHKHGILTDEGPFRTLSGRTPEDERNQKEEGFSWGKPIKMIKAPCGPAVSLGGFVLKNSTVAFTQNAPENLLFEKYPFKANGLIGNQPFVGRAIVTIEIRDCFMRIIDAKETK